VISRTSQSTLAFPSANTPFTRFSSAWFGAADANPAVDAKLVAKYIALMLVLALVLIARRFDAISNPQFWAEDGTIFFRENLIHGFWYSLGNFYRGFPYLLQRLVAAAATPFGIANAPLVYNLAAITIASAASAFFSLPHFRHIVRSDYLRILFCVAVVSLPDSQEIVGTLTNVHWYLAIWALLVSIMKLPVSWWGNVLLLGAYTICVATAPIALITVPIWLVRLALSAMTRRTVDVVVILSVLSLQAASFIITRGLGAESGTGFDLQQFSKSFFNLVVVRVIAQAVVGTERAVETATLHSWVLYLIAGSALALGLLLSALSRFKNFLVALICCYIVLSSVFVTILGRGEMIAVGSSSTSSLTVMWTAAETHVLIGGRYFVLGIAMVYLAYFAAVDRLPPGTVKIVATTALLCQLVFILSQSFILTPFVDLKWQQYADQLSTARLDVGDEMVVIPVNPRPFQIVFGDLTRLKELNTSTAGFIDKVAGTSVGEFQQTPILVPADTPIEVTGWAIDREAAAPARGVAVVTDGQPVWAHYGLARPDVAAAFNNPSYEMSGFSATILELPPGLHTLELRILTLDGRSFYRSTEQLLPVEIEVR
jgi:hypothetical protein